MVLGVGTSQMLQPKLSLESHLGGHSSTHCFDLPSGLPKEYLTKMSTGVWFTASVTASEIDFAVLNARQISLMPSAVGPPPA